MASVASQLIEEVTAHAQSDSPEDAREICADGNNLRKCNNGCSVVSDTGRLWKVWLLFWTLSYVSFFMSIF
jgi:hypothetical protein